MTEARLIDADALEQEVMEATETICEDCSYEFVNMIHSAKTVKSLVRCADCKFFELNCFGDEHGWPGIIVGHEICRFWGGGCKTKPDAFCSFGERKGENSDE